jgi:NAD+ kinase
MLPPKQVGLGAHPGSSGNGSSARAIRAIGVVIDSTKPGAVKLVPEIRRFLTERGITTYLDPEPDPTVQLDLLLTLGGDGTIMRAGRAYVGVPILGVNFGRFGFLAQVRSDEWRTAVEEVLHGEYEVREEPTLDCWIERYDGREDYVGWATGDVVVQRAYRAIISLELYVDGRFVNVFPGDGIIAAVPQGSTAYNLAAGGAIMTSGVKGMAITPMNVHSTSRPHFVVPQEATVEMVLVDRNPAAVDLDGQPAPDWNGAISPHEANLRVNDLVRVKTGPNPFRVVVLRRMDVFAALTEKFPFLNRRSVTPTRGFFPTKRRS